MAHVQFLKTSLLSERKQFSFHAYLLAREAPMKVRNFDNVRKDIAYPAISPRLGLGTVFSIWCSTCTVRTLELDVVHWLPPVVGPEETRRVLRPTNLYWQEIILWYFAFVYNNRFCIELSDFRINRACIFHIMRHQWHPCKNVFLRFYFRTWAIGLLSARIPPTNATLTDQCLHIWTPSYFHNIL